MVLIMIIGCSGKLFLCEILCFIDFNESKLNNKTEGRLCKLKIFVYLCILIHLMTN